MTGYELQAKMTKDFKFSELEKFRVGPSCNSQDFKEADRIIVPDAMLDYLRDFFNGIFSGAPMPCIMKKFVIEWQNHAKIYEMFVQFYDDKPDWILIDIFVGKIYVGKLLYPNVQMEDALREENGRFSGYTSFVPSINVDASHPEAFESSITALKDVFMYAVLYMADNMDNPEIQKVSKVKPSKAEKREQRELSKKNNKKNFNNGRDKRYVPHTKKVYTVEKNLEAIEKMRKYVLSRWKVREYKYTRSDGKEVYVHEHFANRHFPNEGFEKVQGRDYILRERNKRDSC